MFQWSCGRGRHDPWHATLANQPVTTQTAKSLSPSALALTRIPPALSCYCKTTNEPINEFIQHQDSIFIDSSYVMAVWMHYAINNVEKSKYWSSSYLRRKYIKLPSGRCYWIFNTKIQ